MTIEHYDDATLVGRRATLAELRALAESVGWLDHFDWATIDGSLEATLHGVVAVREGETVGMARLLGDGVKYFMIHDVLVHPDHQGDGLAARLVDHLLAHVATLAPARAWVGLFASPEAEHLYAEHGFGTDDMRGMWRWVEPDSAQGRSASPAD